MATGTEATMVGCRCGEFVEWYVIDGSPS